MIDDLDPLHQFPPPSGQGDTVVLPLWQAAAQDDLAEWAVAQKEITNERTS